MSPAAGPMTFDELSELYRMEMKSAALVPARRDLMQAMSALLGSLRREVDAQRARDPDSVMAEGADQRRKKAERLCKDVLDLRARKIAVMAIRGAEGGRNSMDALAPEEAEYYRGMEALSAGYLGGVDKLRTKRTVDTRIDEPPAREAPAEPAPAPEAPQEPFPDFPDEPFPEDDAIPDEPFDEAFDAPPAEVPEPVEAPAEPTPAQEPASVLEPVPEPASEKEPDEFEPVLIRVLQDVPAFSGPDRDYRLSKEDVVTLPRALAEILIGREMAASVRPTP